MDKYLKLTSAFLLFMFCILPSLKVDALGSVARPSVSVPTRSSSFSSTSRPSISKPSVTKSTNSSPHSKWTSSSSKKSFFKTSKHVDSKKVKPIKSFMKSVSKPKKETVTHSKASTSKPPDNKKEKFKGLLSKGKFYKPTPHTSYGFSKYENKPYYNESSGFATGLITAAGAYLILDSINDDDEPIYIDSKTGEQVNPDKADVKVAEQNQSTNSSSSSDEDSSMAIYFTIMVIILIGLIGAILFARYKTK